MPFIQRQLAGNGGFGFCLRELRELRGLTRAQLAEQTRIHESVISALEEERLVDLKDPAYSERHVRAIVRVLEGRSMYFLQKYQELLKAHQIEPHGTMSVKPTVRSRDLIVTSKFVAFGGFLVLAGLAAAYLLWQAYLLQVAPSLTLDSPVEGVHVNSPTVDVRGETDPTATVTVNGRQAVVNRDGHFYLAFDIPRGLTTLTVEARRRYGSSVTETRRVTYGDEVTAADDFAASTTAAATTSTKK